MTKEEITNNLDLYCRSPWKSVKEELPPIGQTVLLATFTGMHTGNCSPGYRVCFGFRTKFKDESMVEPKDVWYILNGSNAIKFSLSVFDCESQSLYDRELNQPDFWMPVPPVK